MALLNLQDNPDIVSELQNPDPEIRASVQRLVDRINACRTTADIDELAARYPDIVFATPPDKNGNSRIYGNYHIRRIAHA
jgi:hypothetical protein